MGLHGKQDIACCKSSERTTSSKMSGSPGLQYTLVHIPLPEVIDGRTSAVGGSERYNPSKGTAPSGAEGIAISVVKDVFGISVGVTYDLDPFARLAARRLVKDIKDLGRKLNSMIVWL